MGMRDARRPRRSVIRRGMVVCLLMAAIVTIEGGAVGGTPDPALDRVGGGSRYETSVLIAQRSFPDGADVTYLARADVFADALAAGILTDGPVLLVPRCDTVPAVVIDEIARLQPRTVVALGGRAAICNEVLSESAGGRKTSRVAGSSRYTTAVAISQRQFPSGAADVYLASGHDSPDAVAGGALTRGPVLLVPPVGAPPDEVLAELDRLEAQRVTVLGGSAAVSDETVAAAAGPRPHSRLFGATRYETAVAISRHEFGPGSTVQTAAPTVYIARGDVFADAVSAGSLADGPVLLVPSCGPVPLAVAAEIDRLGPGVVVALGGIAAVCDAMLDSASGRAPIIASNVSVLDVAARGALDGYEPDGTLRFSGDGTPDLDTGDIVVSQPVPGVAARGLLRHVTARTQDGPAVSYTTKPASLTDAVLRGGTVLSRSLTRDDLVSEQYTNPRLAAAASPQRQSSAALSERVVDVDLAEDVVLYDRDGDHRTTGDQVSLSGSFSMAADLEFGVDVGLDGFPIPVPVVETFETALVVDQASHLTLTGDEAASWASGNIQLWKGNFAPMTVFIGPVPVVLTPEITLTVAADGAVEAHFVVGVDQTAGGRLGAVYERGQGWSPVADHTFAVQPDPPPTLTARADAKATAAAQLQLEVYDVGGPRIDVGVHGRAEAELYNTELCWGVYGGLDVAAGFDLADIPVIGKSLPALDDLEVLSLEKLLVEDPVPHKPCGTRQWVGTITVNRDLFWYYGEENSTRETENATWTLTPSTDVHLDGSAPGDGRYVSMRIQGSGRTYYDHTCDFTTWFGINWPEGETDYGGSLPSGLDLWTDEHGGAVLSTHYTAVTTWREQHCDESEPRSYTSDEVDFTELGNWPHPGYPLVDDDPAFDHLVGTTVLTREDIEMDDSLQEFDVTITYDLRLEVPAS